LNFSPPANNLVLRTQSTLGFTRALINLAFRTGSGDLKTTDQHPHYAVRGKSEGSTDDLAFFLHHALLFTFFSCPHSPIPSQILSPSALASPRTPSQSPAYAIGQNVSFRHRKLESIGGKLANF
ncbi:hypothetical protein AVEN_187599-1, partial [Araneus ventricosus]